MASPTQWTWVWVISGSWWWTGRPGVLQSMRAGLQRVRHDWATELNFISPWKSPKNPSYHCCLYTVLFLDSRAFVYWAVWRDWTLCSRFYISIDPNAEKYLFSSLPIQSVFETLSDISCPKIWSVIDGQGFVFFKNSRTNLLILSSNVNHSDKRTDSVWFQYL